MQPKKRYDMTGFQEPPRIFQLSTVAKERLVTFSDFMQNKISDTIDSYENV